MLGAEIGFQEYAGRIGTELGGVDPRHIEAWSDLIYDCWLTGKCVYVIGNGGSGTTASHFAEDLGKSTLRRDDLLDESKRRLRVLSLTDNAGWLMAIANDIGYDQIFVQQLMNYGDAGDLLIAISGSGSSPNVVNAVDWANRHGLTTFSLTGYDGGRIRELAQAGIHLDLHDMGMVESIHLCLFHWVLDDVYARINETGRYGPPPSSRSDRGSDV